MQNVASAKAPGPTTTRRPSRSNQSIQSPRPTILLSVAGLTLQVITETLYCLVASAESRLSLGEIHLLTTRVCAEQSRGKLLACENGSFFRFGRGYRISPSGIRIGTSCIHVSTGYRERIARWRGEGD